jgi:hypothetical protein
MQIIRMGGQLHVPHPLQKIYFACERLYYLPITIAYLLPLWTNHNVSVLVGFAAANRSFRKTWLRRPARELKR